MLHRRPHWTVGADSTAVCALGEQTSRNIRRSAPSRIPLAVPLSHADECGRQKETRANPSPSSLSSVFVSAAGWLLLPYETGVSSPSTTHTLLLLLLLLWYHA